MAKKILQFVTVILAIIMFGVCMGYIYIKYIAEQKTQITGSFIGKQVDPNTGKEYSLLDVYVYSNGNGKGKEVVEFVLNGYSESTYQTIYSRGVQYVDGNYYTYESNNGHSFASAEEKFKVGKDAKKLPIKIGDEKFAVALNGTYSYTKEVLDNTNLMGWILFSPIQVVRGWLGRNNSVHHPVKITNEYTIGDFISYCRRLAKSNSDGYGTTYLPAVDLSEYFSLYKWNGQSYETASMYDDTNQSMYYFSVNVHYDYRGMTMAKQSAFGAVAYDSQFNISGVESVEYWKTDTVVNLSESDFDVRYSDEYNGNLLSLKQEVIKKINNYEGSITCSVNLNLDNMENVVGFDFYSLYGVKLKGINLISTKETNFVLLPNSLKDTNLPEIKHSSCITINNSSESGYVGGV